MSTVSTERGIVLRRTKYGEHDLVVQILLASGRKKSFMAKAAFKSKRRFAGGALEPTVFLQVEFINNGPDKMGILKQVHVIDDFHALRSDYDRMNTALGLLLAVSKISMEGDEHSEGLFNLIGHSLRVLEKAKDFEKFKTVFGLKLLFQQGVLEIEPWMKPWLRTVIKDWEQFEDTLAIEPSHREWVKRRMHQYLETASVT